MTKLRIRRAHHASPAEVEQRLQRRLSLERRREIAAPKRPQLSDLVVPLGALLRALRRFLRRLRPARGFRDHVDHDEVRDARGRRVAQRAGVAVRRA